MFYEFQTTSAEGLCAKDRTDKAERGAVKKKREENVVKLPRGRPKSLSSINKSRRPKFISTASKIPVISHQNNSQDVSAVSNSSLTVPDVSSTVSHVSPTASNLSPTVPNLSPAASNVSPNVSNTSSVVSPLVRQSDIVMVAAVDMETEPEMPKIDLCSYATPMDTTGPTDELPDEPPQVTQVDVVP